MESLLNRIQLVLGIIFFMFAIIYFVVDIQLLSILCIFMSMINLLCIVAAVNNKTKFVDKTRSNYENF